MVVEGGLVLSISTILSLFGFYQISQKQQLSTQISIARIEEKMEVVTERTKRIEDKLEKMNG